jgi:hypothetical protein
MQQFVTERCVDTNDEGEMYFFFSRWHIGRSPCKGPYASSVNMQARRPCLGKWLCWNIGMSLWLSTARTARTSEDF